MDESNGHQVSENLCKECVIFGVQGQLKSIMCKWKDNNSDFNLFLSEEADQSSKKVFQSLLTMDNSEAKDKVLNVYVKALERQNGSECFEASKVMLTFNHEIKGRAKISLTNGNFGHGFYLGNDWMISCAHNFSIGDDIDTAKVTLSTSDGPFEYQIHSVFTFLPLPGDALEDANTDVMLIKLQNEEPRTIDCTPTEPSHISSNDISLFVPVRTSDDRLLSLEVSCVEIVGCPEDVLKLDVVDISQESKELFKHGQSGSPICDIRNIARGILIQNREDFGYALKFPPFKLLESVNNLMSMNNLIKVNETMKNLRMQYYRIGENQSSFSGLDHSEYRIVFSGFRQVLEWWDSADPELDRGKVGHGNVMRNKATWLLPYRARKTIKRSEKYLIVHIHPKDSQDRFTMNFNCENNNFNSTPFVVGDHKKNFELWHSFEKKMHNNKPSVTKPIDGGEWRATSGNKTLSSELLAMINTIEKDYVAASLAISHATELASEVAEAVKAEPVLPSSINTPENEAENSNTSTTKMLPGLFDVEKM